MLVWSSWVVLTVIPESPIWGMTSFGVVTLSRTEVLTVIFSESTLSFANLVNVSGIVRLSSVSTASNMPGEFMPSLTENVSLS